MTFSHRPAVEADLPQIVEIYNSTIASRQVTADIEPVTVASRLGWLREHGSASRPIWVVGAPGHIDAWLTLSDFHSRPAYRHTAEISIYVRDSARGRGIGAYLLESAMRQAASLEIRSLVGLLFEHNAPSLRLFERFGFTRWGSLPRVAVLDGVERNLVIVGWRADT